MKKLIVCLCLILGIGIVYGGQQPQQLGSAQAQILTFTPVNYTNLFATSTILPTSSYGVLITSGGFPGDQTFKGTPFLSTTTILGIQAAGTVPISTGTIIILTGNTTNQLTLQDSAAQSLSGLNLTMPTVVLSSTKTIVLVFDGARWEQIRGGGQQ